MFALPRLRGDGIASRRAAATGASDKQEPLHAIAFTAVLVGCLALVILAAGDAGGTSAASYWRSFWSGLGLLIMVAAASLGIGGLAGFVFGIPRVPEAREAHAGAGGNGERNGVPSNGGSVALNSNLGQVSDWLTKILLGAGLTQITHIGTTLQTIGAAVAGQNAGLASSIPVLIVYFVVLGFLIFYIWTTTRFAGMVNDAVNSLLSEVNAKADEVLGQVEAWKSDIDDWKKAWDLVENQVNLEHREPDRPVEEFKQALEPLEGRERAMIFYRARVVRHDNWERNKRRMARTMPIFQALVELDRERHFHRNHAQLGYCYKDKLQPDYERALRHLDEAIAIRDGRQVQGWTIYEFNRALCRIELALRRDGRSSPAEQDAVLADLEKAARFDDVGSVLAGPGADPIHALNQHPRVALWCQRNAERIRQSRLAELAEPRTVEPLRDSAD